jgi:hypothetical protein
MSRASLMPFMCRALTLHPTDSLSTAGVQPLIITHFLSKALLEQEFLYWAPPPPPPRPQLTDRRAIPIQKPNSRTYDFVEFSRHIL